MVNPISSILNSRNQRHLKAFVDLRALVPEESVWLANFVSQNTRKSYRRAVDEFIAFHGITDAGELRRVDQAHVIAYREFLQAQGATPATVYSRLSALSSLFKHLCEHRAADHNPTIGVRRPRVDKGRVSTPVITADQVRRMLDAPNPSTLQGIRDRAVLHILFYAGCRVGEVGPLKVRDLFEDAGYWVLRFTIKGGKTNAVAIHPELTAMLRGYLDVAGHGDDRNGPLIRPVRGGRVGPLTRGQVHNIFHRYARLAGLPAGVRPHTARATFITQALERRCPIEAVQTTVGHCCISTTQMYDKRGLAHRDSASIAVRY